MSDRPALELNFLDGHFMIDHEQADSPSGEWLAAVRAPEGLTVVRPARAGEPDPWAAFHSGASAHDLDVPGMLASVLIPLRDHGIPVFASSTYHADIVLVPADRAAAAATALATAGHRVGPLPG